MANYNIIISNNENWFANLQNLSAGDVIKLASGRIAIFINSQYRSGSGSRSEYVATVLIVSNCKGLPIKPYTDYISINSKFELIEDASIVINV